MNTQVGWKLCSPLGCASQLVNDLLMSPSLTYVTRSRRPWATGVFWRLLFFAPCALWFLRHHQRALQALANCLRKVQWNIPRQVNLSCLTISICICIYILYIDIHVIYIYVHKWEIYLCAKIETRRYVHLYVIIQ